LVEVPENCLQPGFAGKAQQDAMQCRLVAVLPDCLHCLARRRLEKARDATI
jgi:hypothetical protein